MPPIIAALGCAMLILWLFRQDSQQHKGVSGAIWIPFIWACVIGSKPISIWLGMGAADSIDGYQDNMLDKLLFLVLIVAAWRVLARRRVDWGAIFRTNRWLM